MPILDSHRYTDTPTTTTTTTTTTTVMVSEDSCNTDIKPCIKKRWQTVDQTVHRGLERVATEEAFNHQVPCHDTDRLYLTPLL